MEEKVFYNISISKKNADRIKAIVQYENLKSKFKTNRSPVEEEDVIKAALLWYLDKVEKFNEIVEASGFNDLGKPYRIKNRFKFYLKEQGMKQNDLSEMTGIDKGNLSLILNNRNQPSLDYFMRIWIALDAPPIEDVLYREKPD